MGRTPLSIFAIATLVATGCSSTGNEGVLPGVDGVVFVKRAYITDSGDHNVAGGSNQVFDYTRYEAGGGVFVLSPPTPDGTLRNLTKDFQEVDINGIDLSFDATQVVFSMRHKDSSHYHIYIANLDGSGDVQQRTFGANHDVKPIWLPGDRIAFSTDQPYADIGKAKEDGSVDLVTRADEYNHAPGVVQLATISAQSGDADRRLCSQNLSHSVDAFLMSDGRVGFSRWEHLGPTNDVKLFAMNPDCSQMVAVAGEHGKPSNSLVQSVEMEPGVFVGVATSRERTIQAGALVKVDARAQNGATGIALDEQNARYEVLTPSVPTDEGSPPYGVGRYRRPHPLPTEGQLLVSWANGDVNERNELAGVAPNFGIYLWDEASRRRTLVYDDPNTWDLYAVPIAPRDIPPVHPGAVGVEPVGSTKPAILGSVDITQTSLDETVQGARLDGMSLADALKQATKVRVIEGFSSEVGTTGQFGLTLHEGAAILGEVPILQDGSWEAAVVPMLPYHLQPLDEFGLSIRNQRLWIQAMPGEQRRCGGCHEGRTDTILPRMGTTTLAQQAGAVDLNKPAGQRMEFPWHSSDASLDTIQDLFDAKCASCHGGGTNDPFAGVTYTVEGETMDGEAYSFAIPYLNLSSTTLEVYYDGETYPYPLSYISLLYPSAMMGDSEVAGAPRPEGSCVGDMEGDATDTTCEWVVPASARTSPLIRKVNAVSQEDPSLRAWDAPLHPEDQNVGISLTPEERLMLIRMVDLGGQYFSRRNAPGFEPSGTQY